MRKSFLASLCVLALLLLDGCVTVPNTRVCTVAGEMSAGAICAETLTPSTFDLTLAEFLDMLEPVPDVVDPTDPSKVLVPGRAGAMVMTADDWLKNKTALESACRELGSKCSYEVQHAIAGMNTPIVKAKQAQ